MDKNNAEAVVNTSLETCVQKYEDYVIPAGTGLYCNWTWDQVLCWPPTRAGTVAKQRCPSYNGVDQTKFAYKRCSVDGRWEGKTLGEYSSPAGWTNYTPCYLPEVLKLMRKLYAGSEAAARVKMDIAERTRTLEIVGFSVSLTALLISLAIFCHFRSLRNNRTRIHKNLFIAMVIQVVIRLTLYIDQAVIRGASGNDVAPGGGTGQSNRSTFSVRTHRQGIDNTPILCEASYVLLEYARTSMFMWMFIEGLYLHNMITVTVFQENSYYSVYTLVGWGGPVVMTTAWAVTTALRYGSSKCWWGYNLTHYFWILEGPRLGVIVLNFMFLLNIIRVLVVKLRQSHTSEIEQVRKAVRAALVLLPLLGITNLVNMAEAPLDRAVWEFALWSYTTHFLTSFQGFFIAFLYCFLNGEVRMAVMKSISIYLSLRQYQFTTRRNSIFSGVYITAELQQPPHLRGLPPVPPAPPPPRRPRQDDLDDDDDDGDLDEEEEDEEEDLEVARRRRRAASGRGRSSGSRSTTSRRRSLWTRLCCWWCASRGSSMVREAAMVSGMVSGAVGAVGGCSQPPQTQGCSSGVAAGGSPTSERPAPETRV